MPETVVDYERAWVALKKYVASKPSHGRRDMNDAMASIEVESVVMEEEERVARLASSAEGNGHDSSGAQEASSAAATRVAAHA